MSIHPIQLFLRFWLHTSTAHDSTKRARWERMLPTSGLTRTQYDGRKKRDTDRRDRDFLSTVIYVATYYLGTFYSET